MRMFHHLASDSVIYAGLKKISGRILICLTFSFSLWDIFPRSLPGCSPGEAIFLENLADYSPCSEFKNFGVRTVRSKQAVWPVKRLNFSLYGVRTIRLFRQIIKFL